MYRLYHIGVYTLDVEESLRFYLDVLGFTLEWRGVVHHPTGLVEAATLTLDGFTVELVKPVDLSRVRPLAGPVQHIALMVDSLDDAMEDLRKKNIPLSQEGVEVIGDFMQGIRHCFIAGPSGERIEICETLRAAGE